MGGLGAAGAEQAAEPDDLAAAHGEVDTAQVAGAGDPLDLEQHLALAGGAAAELGHAGRLDVGHAGAFVNPEDPEGTPTVQDFCVPTLYLDRDTLTLSRRRTG